MIDPLVKLIEPLPEVNAIFQLGNPNIGLPLPPTSMGQAQRMIEEPPFDALREIEVKMKRTKRCRVSKF